MSNHRQDSRLFGPSVLMLLVAGAAFGQQAPPPAPVHVGYALEQDMAPFVWVPGTVVSRNVAPIATQVAGQLTWVAEVGDRVSKGQAVARIDDASLQLQLRNDDATIKRLQAQLTYLEQQVERMTRLSEQQVVPANDLEEAEAQHQAVEQELVQAKVARERTLYELERTRVEAPFAGEIVRRLQQPGSYSSVGEEVVFLVDTSEVEVLAQAPLSVAPHLSEGMAVTVEAGGRQIQGKLRRIITVGDERSRMFEIRVALGREPSMVGTAVKVALPTDQSRRVIAVPRDALILRSDGIYVFRVTDDGKAERVTVETGMGHDSLIEVRGALDSGDKVVVRGGERLRPGQTVSITAAADIAGSPAG
jgi:RND family efflux transporter MFP subunit